MGQNIPSIYLTWRAPDIAAVGTIFYVLRYDVVLDRYLNLTPPRRRLDALSDEPRWQVISTMHYRIKNSLNNYPNLL